MKPKAPKLDKDWKLSNTQFEWDKRRRTIYATLIFCSTLMIYILYRGDDSSLYRDAFNTLALLGGSVLGTWIGGSVWDDLNARKWGTPQAPQDEVPAPAREPSEE